MSITEQPFHPAFAVVRVAPAVAPRDVTVKKVYWSETQAEAEIERLNTTGRRVSVYFAQPTRVFARDPNADLPSPFAALFAPHWIEERDLRDSG